MIAQTAVADRATMLASLVRIFKRLSRLIFALPEKNPAEGVSKTFLPIMNVNEIPLREVSLACGPS